MAAPEPASVTALLEAARHGDDHAFDAVYQAVYDELRRLARVIKRGRAGATLNTTALVHEAYLRLVPARNLAWEDRMHFFRVAARAMRHALVQAARRQMAGKRGGGAMTVLFDENVHATPVRMEEVLALDDVLGQLEALDSRQARIVECRFFAGLSIEETAEALGVGPATVKRDWRAARAWLVRALS